MTKQCKHKFRECYHCKNKLKVGKFYVLDPELPPVNGLPVIFHAQCYKLFWRK